MRTEFYVAGSSVIAPHGVVPAKTLVGLSDQDAKDAYIATG